MTEGMSFRQRMDRMGWAVKKALSGPVSVSPRGNGKQRVDPYEIAQRYGVREQNRGDKWTQGLQRVDYALLRRICGMHTLTRRLIQIYSFHAAHANWDCVPDVEAELDELRRWQNQEVVNLFQDWSDTEIAPFESAVLKGDLTKVVRNNVEAIHQAKVNGADENAIIRMLEQTFDAAEAILTQEAKRHASKVRDLLAHPNNQEEKSFSDLIEPWSRDLCMFGIGYVALDKPRSAEVAGRSVSRLRWVQADQMNHYVTKPEGALPQPPAPAFIRRIDGMPYEWFRRDQVALAYYEREPDTYGTGPPEAALQTITFGAKLDRLNEAEIMRFYLGQSMINLGPDRTQEAASALGNAIRDLVRRGGTSGEIPMLAGVPWETSILRLGGPHRFDATLITLDDRTNAEICGAFGLSPQDAAQIWDFHRTTAETQLEITRVNGFRTFLKRLESVINQQIVKPNFPFKDVKFVWTDLQAEDIIKDHGAWMDFVNGGVVTRGSVAAMLGKPQYPGQGILTFKSQFDTPVSEIQTVAYRQRSGQGQQPPPPGGETNPFGPQGGAPNAEGQQAGSAPPPTMMTGEAAVPVPAEFNPWASKAAGALSDLKRRIGSRADDLVLKAERGDAEGVKRIATELKFRAERDIEGIMPGSPDQQESLTSLLDRLMAATDKAVEESLASLDGGEDA